MEPFVGLEQARRSLVKRSFLAILLLAAAGLGLYKERISIGYLLSWQGVRDLGDLRDLYLSGKKKLPARPFEYVRLENMLVTHDELESSSGKYRYFFCPIYDIVVRTSRPLPEPPIRIARVAIPNGLEFLVEQGKAQITDFGRSFDARGMLLRLRDMPGFRGGIDRFARERLKLSPEEIDEAWGLLDGETPQDQYQAMFMLGVALLSLVLAVGLVASGTATYRKASRAVS